MGYAKIIKGISFAAKNLGKVTPVQTSDLQSLEIVQGATNKNRIQFDVNYISTNGNPVKTEQKSVVWSITSGNENATINENSGLLNIVSSGSVTVKVVSLYNSEIFAERTISVEYVEVIIKTETYGYNGIINDKANGTLGFTNVLLTVGGDYDKPAIADGVLQSICVGADDVNKIFVGIIDQNNVFIERASYDVSGVTHNQEKDVSHMNIEVLQGEYVVLFKPSGTIYYTTSGTKGNFRTGGPDYGSVMNTRGDLGITVYYKIKHELQ